MAEMTAERVTAEPAPTGAARVRRILTSDTAARWQSRAVLLALWALASAAFHRIPGPVPTLEMIIDEFQAGEVFPNLIVTLERALIGLAGVLVIGVSVGIAMARWWRVRALLDDIVYVGVALPAFILALLFVMWWGFNPTGPVILVIVAATPLMILSTREGAMAVDANLIKMSSSYGVKAPRRLRWLVVPAMMEYIISGIRSSALAAWGALLLIEWFGSDKGAGFRAHEWYENGNLTGLMAWGVIWIVVVMLIDGVILGRLLNHFTKWRGSDSGAWSGGGAGPVH